MIRAELQAIYWPRASFSGSRHSALSLASLSAFTACQRRNRLSTLGAHQRQHRNADKQITTTQIHLRFPGPMFRGFRLVMRLIFLIRAPSGEIARFFVISVVSADVLAEGALVRVISDALAEQQRF